MVLVASFWRSYAQNPFPRGERAKNTARPALTNASKSSGAPRGGYRGTGAIKEEDASMVSGDSALGPLVPAGAGIARELVCRTRDVRVQGDCVWSCSPASFPLSLIQPRTKQREIHSALPQAVSIYNIFPGTILPA